MSIKQAAVTPAMILKMSAADRKALGFHDNYPDGRLPHPKPQRDKAPALESANAGEAKGFCGAVVRFTLFRVRPLDPDNAAGSVKDLLDGLRHASIIKGDEWWRIRLETEQVKVGSYAEEKTVIRITESDTSKCHQTAG